MSSQRNRLQLNSLNEHITCVLCGGYMVEATAITTCLHTFCKTCIVQYLAGSNYCPICDEWIHHSNPCLKLRRDRTLQDLIYKLVPGMLSGEKRRRKEYLEQNLAHGDSGVADVSVMSSDGQLYTEDDEINVLLEFSPNGKPIRRRQERVAKEMPMDYDMQSMRYRRYLLCPASFTVALVKKFLRLKFNIPIEQTIGVFHAGEQLPEYYTVMDIAYIYTLRRSRPLRLYFSVFKTPCCSSPINYVVQSPSTSPSRIRNDVSSVFLTSVASPTKIRLTQSSLDCIRSDASKLPVRFDIDTTMFNVGKHTWTNRITTVDRVTSTTRTNHSQLASDDATKTRRVLGDKFVCGDVSAAGNKAKKTSATTPSRRTSRTRLQTVEKRIKTEIELPPGEEIVIPRKLSVTINRSRLSSDSRPALNCSERSLIDDSSVGTTGRNRRADAADGSPSRSSCDSSGFSTDLDELHRRTSHLRLSTVPRSRATKPCLPVTISRDFVKELVFARGLEMLGRAAQRSNSRV